MKLLSVVPLAVMVMTANAWKVAFWYEDDYKGVTREYHSSTGEEGCYNLSSDIAAEVGSFKWVPCAISCSITFHSDYSCSGANLGASTACWSKRSTSAAGSKMKSFRVQGCYGNLPGCGYC
ncbi:hypothetical protein EC991_009821 [Linnemannia zychae]|nr:hypothetical protein EC991_009821 [Linnemannia zychae]